MDDLEDLWGERLDGSTRSLAQATWERYRKVKVTYRIESARPHDHRIDFVVVVAIDGRRVRRGAFEPYREIRWAGTLDDRDDTRFLKPLR